MLSPENSFKRLGVIGFLLGGPLTFFLARHGGLSPDVEAFAVAAAVFMLLGMPLAIKVLTGTEAFIFYRELIGIFVAVSVALGFLHQPILPYLDVTTAGIAVFHACGRIGCLLAGCCFGRPHRFGIRYRQAHAAMGFPRELVGVRLFPVQAVESAWVLILSACASILVWRHAAPGSAFSCYVAGYALGRFFLEFARVDAERPYWLGFSLPQWISMLLTSGIAVAEFADMLPGLHSRLGLLVFLPLAMLVVAITRHFATGEQFQLRHPRHVHELAQMLEGLLPIDCAAISQLAHPSSLPQIVVVQTSLGIRLSTSQVADCGCQLRHYCLSRRGTPLSPRSVCQLARQISHLRHNSAAFTVHLGRHGAAHLIFSE